MNIGASLASRILLLLVALYMRRLVIVCIGNEVNGLNSLYGNIISLLSVAELGVGSAIIFSMYKPIVEGNERKITALYCLYRRLYRIIGAVIFALGMAVMPFLPRLMYDYESIDINVYWTFFLVLISAVMSYLFGAKTSLIEAYKDNYITTAIVTGTRLLRYVLQIAALLIWRSYVIFLICEIIETVMIWAMTDVAVKKLHPGIVAMREKLDKETEKEVSSNIKAMFMHKIGTVLVNMVDSMVISAFVGVVALGKYTNYAIVSSAITKVISLFFGPVTSVVGHLCASADKIEIRKYFKHFYSLNLVLGMIFFLGYYAVIDSLVALIFGTDLIMSRTVPFVIALNYFITYMRFSLLLFKDAAGAFYYDRWKPVAEGIVNLILSIAFVKIFPTDYAVVGVIAATIITSIFICDIVEPHIVCKYVLKQSAKSLYFKNYANIGVFVLCLIVEDRLMLSLGSNALNLIVNGLISVAFSLAVLFVMGLVDREFGRECRVIARQAIEWTHRMLKKIKTSR